MLPIRTILHPTDFSERSASAFCFAASLARDHGARIVVLHVYPPPAGHSETVARRQPDGFTQSLWQQLKRWQVEGVPVEHFLAEGEPAAEILRLAREKDCDLIIMGTHGRTGLRRLLLGSVAEEVMRLAPCPVLTVNTPFPHAAEAVSPPPRETVPV
jgi:nucleotide-binding universal stress UspA family protein